MLRAMFRGLHTGRELHSTSALSSASSACSEQSNLCWDVVYEKTSSFEYWYCWQRLSTLQVRSTKEIESSVRTARRFTRGLVRCAREYRSRPLRFQQWRPARPYGRYGYAAKFHQPVRDSRVGTKSTRSTSLRSIGLTSSSSLAFAVASTSRRSSWGSRAAALPAGALVVSAAPALAWSLDCVLSNIKDKF